MTSIIDPAVLLDRGQPTPPDLSSTAMEGRLSEAALQPGASQDRKVAGCRVQGSELVVTLNDEADPSEAENASNYLVMINGTTYLPLPGRILYAPASRMISFKALPIQPGDHVSVTIMGLWDQNKYIPGPSVTCRTQVPRRSRQRWIFPLIIGGALLVLIVIVFARVG